MRVCKMYSNLHNIYRYVYHPVDAHLEHTTERHSIYVHCF